MTELYHQENSVQFCACLYAVWKVCVPFVGILHGKGVDNGEQMVYNIVVINYQPKP